MISYFGTNAAFFEDLKNTLDIDLSSSMRHVTDPSLVQLEKSDLVLIGPDIVQPVKYVQEIVHQDRYISIFVLRNMNDFQSVKQSLQFSPSVGKNSSVILFDRGINFTNTFHNAVTRTQQKRSFDKLNTDETKIAMLSSSPVRFENLGDALEIAPIGILMLDKDANIIGANRRSKAMFSQIHHNIISLRDLFNEKMTERILADAVQKSESVIEIEDLQGHFYEITNSGFNETGVLLLLISDITERKEKDKRIHFILESLPQISWTADAEGRIDFFSQAWYSYTNQIQEDALGNGWHGMVHAQDLTSFVSKFKEAIQHNRIFQHAVRLRQSNGEFRWHLCRVVLVEGLKALTQFWAGTFTDVHDQVVNTERLEQKVKERTRLLEETNAELEQFVHVASHDLREPLRKIKTFSNMIKDDSAGTLTENSKRFLDKVIETSERMTRLLKDLLNFNSLRNDTGVTDVQLNDVINQAIEDLELVISQGNAEIDVAPLPSIKGRPHQIKQLFFNLIGNSLKYVTEGARPKISITGTILPSEKIIDFEYLSFKKSYLEIVIQDNGIGFSQEYSNQIFTIFQRLHVKGSYEGNGIGLAICKKIVTNHGGAITAVSSPGSGAAFHIILPVN
ncbi:MAG: ATP-binding protein [Chryseolinea sp.]